MTVYDANMETYSSFSEKVDYTIRSYTILFYSIRLYTIIYDSILYYNYILLCDANMETYSSFSEKVY